MMGQLTSRPAPLHPLAGKRVVVLAGPTAVGKSALAMRLCEVLHGELISVDSVQVYRNLQIGANKPSASERSRVRHHLLDVRDPTEEYTAGAFYKDALHAVESVLSRGNLPVLVGGTSMYMRWLTSGRPDAPKAEPAVVERVRALLAPHEAASDWSGGLEHLINVDPSRAAQLSKNDWYRLHRALTVALQTEQPVGSLATPADPDGLDALRDALDMRCFFLSAPREPLCRRIDERCEAMLTGGLLEETNEQLLTGSLLPSSPAGRAIGYRQTLTYLTRPDWKPSDAHAFSEYVRDFTAASRRYAGQQVKWFRSEARFEWVASDWDAPERAEKTLLERVQCERADFDAGLVAPAQSELRALEPNLDKLMKTYMPRLPSTIDDAKALGEMLARADACREKLQPTLPALLEKDGELAERFPYHRREKEPGVDEQVVATEGGGGREAGEGEAESVGQKRRKDSERP